MTHWLDKFLQKTDLGWSRGIIVGNNGSRILAEASLISLDRRLKRQGLNFIRFVGDFRIFTKKDAVEAQKALKILNSELNANGLALNDSKVSVKAISDLGKQKGRAILSGEDVKISGAVYEQKIPMIYSKQKKKADKVKEYEANLMNAYSKYESGKEFTE